MVSFIKTTDNFENSDIRPINRDEIKRFKANAFSQPMPNASDEEVIRWVSDLAYESYHYKKPLHHQWYANLLDYYTVTSTTTKQKAGRDTRVDADQDTEIPVPALIKRYVDLGAFWLTREIFKVEPFMQFASYSNEDDVRKAQKLYERKLQGDTETYGARERCTQIGIDLFLYGNSVAKAQFQQERIVYMDMPEMSLDYEESNTTDPFDISSGLDEAKEPVIVQGDSEPIFDIIDQYAEFKPVFLGHFIIDPYAPNRDWRRAAYMGDVEFMSAEQIVERFGSIPGFMAKFKRNSNSKTSIDFGMLPLVGSSDEFLKSWCSSNLSSESIKGRKMHSVTYMYTRYTETCIIDNNIVVYHKYRNIKIKNMGVFPYVMFKMPTPSGGLFATGYGHFLRNIQLEQTIMASKRLEIVSSISGFLIQYMEGSVDEAKLQKAKSVDGITFLEVSQPGAVQEMAPNPALMNAFLDAETRNFERAREYVNVPGMIDSSNTKTHLGAVSQRMEASQVQFDAILESVRSNFKNLYHKIHVLNKAYLDGDIDIHGSTNLFNKQYVDNVLTADMLKILSTQPELSIELNIGVDMNADKLKSFSALMNTPLVAQILQQIQQQGILPPDKQLQVLGMLFDLGGLTDFRSVFNLDGTPLPPPPPMTPPGMGGSPGAPPQVGGEMPPEAAMGGQPSMPPGMM